jgi:hypothetical protein
MQGDKMALAVQVEEQGGEVAITHKDFRMRHDGSHIEIGQQALRTVTAATAEDSLNGWIGKESVEFRGPCGITSGQVIVFLKEARSIVHAKAQVLQDPDTGVEFLLLKGTRWRCQANAVTRA